MTTNDLIERCNAAIAACLERAKKGADADEANRAKTFAEAADLLCYTHERLRKRDEKETP